MKPNNGERCPHCGGQNGVTINERASGWVERWVMWDGEIESTSYDKLRERSPVSGSCIDCGRKVLNPMRTHGEMAPAPSPSSDPVP